VNLFRITWKNDVKTGLYGGVKLRGDSASHHRRESACHRLGWKIFPTGAHKVGAAFGCLVPRLVSGEFDPEKHKARGLRRGIIVAAARLIVRCWAARPSRFCRKACRASGSRG